MNRKISIHRITIGGVLRCLTSERYEQKMKTIIAVKKSRKNS